MYISWAFSSKQCITFKNIAIFWVVVPCSWAEVHWHFRGACCICHQGSEPHRRNEYIYFLFLSSFASSIYPHFLISGDFATGSWPVLIRVVSLTFSLACFPPLQPSCGMPPPCPIGCLALTWCSPSSLVQPRLCFDWLVPVSETDFLHCTVLQSSRWLSSYSVS